MVHSKRKQSVETVPEIESIRSWENTQKGQEGPRLLFHTEDYLNALSLIPKSQTTASPLHRIIKIFSLFSFILCIQIRGINDKEQDTIK